MQRLARYATGFCALSGRTVTSSRMIIFYANSGNDTANFVITVNRPGNWYYSENETYQLTSAR
jgi:hypothetical protein